MDICLFRFLRFRFYSDLLRFVSPHLRVVPPVWRKYLWDRPFVEPKRAEVTRFGGLWSEVMHGGGLAADQGEARVCVSADSRAFLCGMVARYPYMLEPMVV